MSIRYVVKRLAPRAEVFTVQRFRPPKASRPIKCNTEIELRSFLQANMDETAVREVLEQLHSANKAEISTAD